MSFINHQYKHVFIHVPKCAGTSMERYPWVGGNSHHEAKLFVKDAPDDFFSWGFVRNPYDRILSLYCSMIQHRTNRNKRAIKEDVSFATYIESLRETDYGMVHSKPMAEFLCWKDGKIAVDFVGRYEMLEHDWAYVCKVLNQKDTDLKHLNGTDHRPWREMLNSQIIATINELFEIDFETFGYSMLKP